MKRKVKRMNVGGNTGTTQQPTYPFSTNAQQPAAGAQEGQGVNQTFNMQPQAQAGTPRQMTFRKGGYVKKADGAAQRGKTRGKIY